jgi:NitT/TauT family transport system substrate-binding protein
MPHCQLAKTKKICIIILLFQIKNVFLQQIIMNTRMKYLLTSFLTIFLSIGNACAQTQVVYTPTWTAQAQFAGFYAADAMGFYREEGLDVVIKHPSASSSGINRLKKGESQFISLQLVSALEMINEGDELVNVMQYFQQSGQMIISHEPIKGLKSLNGKRIGHFRAGVSKLPIALGHKLNLDIEWIPFISHTNLFISGAIDATLAMSYNELYQLKMAGQRLRKDQLLYMRDIGYNVPEDGLYVTKSYYREHKAEVDKFVRATKKGWEYVATHPKETLDIVMFYMQQAGTSSNLSAQRWMLDECLRLLKNPKTGKRTYRLEPAGLNLANSILCEGGELKKPISYKQITEP